MVGLGPSQIYSFQANTEKKQEYLDVVLLDWMIPKLDGVEVLRRMKKMTNKVPVIFVTARDYVGDNVAGQQMII